MHKMLKHSKEFEKHPGMADRLMSKTGGPDKIEKQKGKYMFDVKTGKKVDVTKYFTKAKSKAISKIKNK